MKKKDEKVSKVSKKKKELKTDTTGKTSALNNKVDEPMFEDVEKKSPFMKIFLSLIIVALLITAGYLLFKSDKKNDIKKSPKIQKMQALASQIDTMKSEVSAKQDEIFNLITQYKKQGGSDIPTYNSMNLSENERKLLEQRIADEKDNSVKSLLSGILDKNKEIDNLKKRIAEIELLLPKPHIVNKGENHFNIAMDYLINQKGLDKKKAKKLAERAGMFENLVPGFRVWNFYSDGIYGTFVTQGSAIISPNQLRRNAKKVLVDAKDKAISERDMISNELEFLKQKKQDIIEQLTLLNTEKQKLINNIDVLSQRNEEFKTKINSLFFRLDTKDKLKAKGIIKGGFLRRLKIRDYSPKDFNKSIDLRKVKNIVVSAKRYNKKAIKKLAVYPRFLKKDKDYKIVISKDKQNAEVIILDIEKMKNERIVISII